jgi:hypothetical protein
MNCVIASAYPERSRRESRRASKDSDGLRRDYFAPLAMTVFMTELRREKHTAVLGTPDVENR